MTRKAHDLSELAEGSAYCRAFGHGWTSPHPASFEGKGRKAGWAVTLICTRCGTEKHFSLSRRGELSAPRYVYPDNYLATFFIGPEERAEFRLDALHDILPGFDEINPAPLQVINGGKRGSA